MTDRTAATSARARTVRIARAVAPGAVAVVAVAVAIWTFLAFSVTFPSSGVWQRILATLVTYVGAYMPLGDGDEHAVPPTSIAVPSTFAFAITLTAAASLVVVMSRRARNAVRVWVSQPQLAVIGADTTAAHIVNSAIAHKLSTVLVTDKEDSPAGLAARGVLPVLVVPNLEAPTASPGLLRLVRRADNVVLATESAAENLRLRQELRPLRPTVGLDDFRSLMAVVKDPRLAESMRPARLRGAFSEEDVTCPSENIAEHICHLIDAAATGPRVIASREGRVEQLVDEVVVEVVGVEDSPYDDEPWADLGETVELWVRRLSWGRVFLNGDELGDGAFNPIVPVRVAEAGADRPERSFVIRVYAGSPTRCVTAALDHVAEHSGDIADLTILTADPATARATKSLTSTGAFDTGQPLTGDQWLAAGARLAAGGGDGERPVSTTVVVDPVAVGLDARLVVDAITLQWARMFAQTYEFMFAGDWSIIGWRPGSPLGDGVSEAENDAAAAAYAAAREKDLSPEDAARKAATAREKARKAVNNRYSSHTAVQNMLAFLDDAGYELVRSDRDLLNPPVAPQLTKHEVETIAGKEHDDWRGEREWIDRSAPGSRLSRLLRAGANHESQQVTAEFSTSGVRYFTLGELTAGYDEIQQLIRERVPAGVEITDEQIDRFPVAANYNRRIVTETYPAIAATFGYSIVRKGDPALPVAAGDDSAAWWVFSRRPNDVRAVRQADPWEWTTSGGDVLTGQAGDWLVTDQWGASRSVGADKFDALYAPSSGDLDSDVYHRIGRVRARPAQPGEVVESQEGGTTAQAGDWLVEGELGERWLVPGVDFSRGYVSSGPP